MALSESLLTLGEAALKARLSTKTLVRAIARGELVAFKVGGRWRIREKDFVAWIERGRAVAVAVEPVMVGPLTPVRGSLSALRQIEAAA